MIKCRVSPFFETDDFRRAVSTALVNAGFRETADEYWQLTRKARSPDEAIVSPPLPSMIELDWVGVQEPALAIEAGAR